LPAVAETHAPPRKGRLTVHGRAACELFSPRKGTVLAVTQCISMEFAATDAAGIGRARRALTQYAGSIGLDAEAQDAIALAVTEAMTNCVLHAYDGDAPTSSYRVEAHADGGELVVTVQDWGVGIAGDGDTPRASKNPGLGYGLALIRLAASTVDIASAVDRGTRIQMRFRNG
jgi:stage II sporulation protein AB (anti-sigma F factor)